MREERQEDTGGTQSEIDQVMVKINQKNHDTDNSATLTAIVFKEQKISLNSIYLYASFYYSYSNTFISCFFWYLLAFLCHMFLHSAATLGKIGLGLSWK